jgi:hypothetical protein
MIAEEISYDALDTSVNESRGSKRKSVDDSELPRKRRSVNSTTLSAVSGRSIGSAKSGKSSKSSAKTTTKYHYPKVLSQPSQQLLSATREGDHATVLRLLVEELVEQEKSALNAHFQSAEISNMKGRRHIFGSLDKLLTDLPEIVQQASHSSLQFEAEGSTGGSSELATLIEVKNVLLQHSAKLERYEQDLTALAEDQDLWIGRERIVETIRAVIRVSFVAHDPVWSLHKCPILTGTERTERRGRNWSPVSRIVTGDRAALHDYPGGGAAGPGDYAAGARGAGLALQQRQLGEYDVLLGSLYYKDIHFSCLLLGRDFFPGAHGASRESEGAQRPQGSAQENARPLLENYCLDCAGCVLIHSVVNINVGRIISTY